jgi:hypothetical protein
MVMVHYRITAVNIIIIAKGRPRCGVCNSTFFCTSCRSFVGVDGEMRSSGGDDSRRSESEEKFDT